MSQPHPARSSSFQSGSGRGGFLHPRRSQKCSLRGVRTELWCPAVPAPSCHPVHVQPEGWVCLGPQLLTCSREVPGQPGPLAATSSPARGCRTHCNLPTNAHAMDGPARSRESRPLGAEGRPHGDGGRRWEPQFHDPGRGTCREQCGFSPGRPWWESRPTGPGFRCGKLGQRAGPPSVSPPTPRFWGREGNFATAQSTLDASR